MLWTSFMIESGFLAQYKLHLQSPASIDNHAGTFLDQLLDRKILTGISDLYHKA